MISNKTIFIFIFAFGIGLSSCRVRQETPSNVQASEFGLADFAGRYELLNPKFAIHKNSKELSDFKAEITVDGKNVVLNANFSAKSSPVTDIAQGAIFSADVEGKMTGQIFRKGSDSFKGMSASVERKITTMASLSGRKITQVQHVFTRPFLWDDKESWQFFQLVQVSLTLNGRHLLFVRSVYDSAKTQTEYTELHFSKNI